ncbi:TetR family transcriptional regulator [Streptomyces violaceusniger]|uniref:TetR/AcrR family transcriptional regulator n=2 Tax=Streptomyces violaceusniger group TaxID=2839105 RepID=A0ABD5JMI8_9ACTN|nr:TetR/AcrR family transcriptional regulator [Streptomyces violaceusniger]KUL42994.1 TetR family transcriptional regulator [Streptomyces violaceusniger]MEE4589657.1 TetR/AcrR family transcriptional regulator [Streptomyces sp. DSM 41602]
MPTARESLLDAAFAALEGRPWPRVKMAEVAAAAGVSRQTLYNQFGSKEGLARALVRREADAYLSGVERALSGASGAAGPRERLAAAAVWTVRSATENPLVRAVLTGCWNERLPTPVTPVTSVTSVRTASPGPLPAPGELLGQARDRAVRLLAGDWPPGAVELPLACEAVARLALSYVVAPAPAADVARMVRTVLA